MNAKSSKLEQYSEELVIVQNSRRFSGQDTPCDIITTYVQPKPSSIHVCRTLQLKGLVYQQLSLQKTAKLFSVIAISSTKKKAQENSGTSQMSAAKFSIDETKLQQPQNPLRTGIYMYPLSY